MAAILKVFTFVNLNIPTRSDPKAMSMSIDPRSMQSPLFPANVDRFSRFCRRNNLWSLCSGIASLESIFCTVTAVAVAVAVDRLMDIN